ncbi:MAG: sulfur carrier protein ThiS [Plesiomonas sp.]
MMQIVLNGQPQTLVTALTVAELLQQRALPVQGCAVALNQQILPRSQWAHTRLQAGDQLAVFQAIAGG